MEFTPLADADAAEAFAWYEGWRGGLGEEFLADVERAVGLVADNPEAGARSTAGCAGCCCTAFPYSLYYRLDAAAARVEVRACVHQRRHPRHWRRLREA